MQATHLQTHVRNISFTRAILHLFLACAIISCSGCTENQSSPETGGVAFNEYDGLPATPQSSLDRRIVDIEGAPVDSITLQSFEGNPVTIAVMRVIESDDALFILDPNAERVLKYNLTGGSIVAVYGSGVGNGPSEHQAISNFAISEDSVFIADGQGRKVSVYSKAGELNRSIPLTFSPHSIAIVENKIIVSTTLRGTYLFREIDSNGTIHKFGSFTSEVIQTSGMSGLVRSSPHGDFVFLSALGGPLIKYADRDSLLYFRLSMVGTNFPPTISNTGSQATVATLDAASISGRSDLLNVTDSEIIAMFLSTENAMQYVDFYNLGTGDYTHTVVSPLLSRGCGARQATASYLYVYCSTDKETGVIYKYERPRF
jgi:hypothetical protein